MAEKAHPPMFTEWQRKLLAFTIAFLAFVLSGALVVFLFVLFGRLLSFFSSVLWPVAVAGILALILRPLVERLEYRFRGRRLLAVITLYTVFVLFMAGVLLLVLPPLIQQIIDFFSYAPDLWDKMVTNVHAHYPQWIEKYDNLMRNPTIAGAATSVREQMAKIPAIVIPSLRVLKEGLWALISFITHFAIIPVYLFFFLLSRTDGTERLPEHLTFVSPSLRNDIAFLAHEFITTTVTFFRGQLLIGLIMGCLYAVGFTLVGLHFGLFIGLLMGLLNIVPYLGTIVGLMITIPLGLFQDGGGPTLVALVLLVKIVTQAIEGWFLTPKIMGHRTGLHPALIIFAVFFWGTAFDGILGMILAIPLTAFFVTFWRLLKRKYF